MRECCVFSFRGFFFWGLGFSWGGDHAALHVTGVAEATMSGLGGALVEAHLQVELTLVGAQLLLGEGALVLVGHLGAQGGAGELGVLLRLQGKPQLLGRLSQKNFLVREMSLQTF